MVAPTSLLLVDDDEQLLRAYQRALGREAKVHLAGTAADALRIAQKNSLDALVIDYALGGASNGIDLLRELKPQQPNAAFLLVTGYASPRIIVEAMRAGADDVRAKPLVAKALLRWVEFGTWTTNNDDIEETATLQRVQFEHIQRVLADCDGNQSEAARRLGIERATVRRHLKKGPPKR